MIDQEGRNGGDLPASGLRLVGTHVDRVGSGGQHPVHVRRVETGLDGEPSQGRVVAEHLALGEEAKDEPPVNGPLHPLLLGEVQQAVRVEVFAGWARSKRACTPARSAALLSRTTTARPPEGLAPYLAASSALYGPSRTAGAPGSSSKLRQTTSTSLACSKRPSAVSRSACDRAPRAHEVGPDVDPHP